MSYTNCPDAAAKDGEGSSLLRVITPKEKDLGEFSVRRALPQGRTRSIGPWVFFDHFGPAHFSPGEGMNVRPHPHINLATVTYLFEGAIHHLDSVGSDAVIRPGAINLMVAGKGIVHSERPAAEMTESYQMEGLQLWHALPESEEERDPSFHHYPSDDIPTFEADGVKGRVMMGEAYGVKSPVLTFHPTIYFEASLAAGACLDLPDVEELAIYVTSGSLNVDGETCPVQSLSVLDMTTAKQIHAETDARFAAVGGAPIGQRFIEWNFVSSRKERIQQAAHDWKVGNFPKVVGDSDEYIPLPEIMERYVKSS
ncbi:MAG: pirin family protein [Pseudomonadota bacterium]